ncbi:MAG: choline ABC transporter permease [Thermoleophilia bacterium]
MSSVATDYAVSAPLVVRRPWWQSRLVLVAAIVAGMGVAYGVAAWDYPWPSWLAWESLSGYLDRFQIWLSDQRNAEDPSLVFVLFNGFASFLDDLVGWLFTALTEMTWAGTTATATLLSLRFGGVRAGAVMLSALASFALLGLWSESMETLSLMVAAVALSLLVGIPVGIAAGRSDRVQRALAPVLDAMQIVPAFAYLMPVVILFSVGPGAAVVTTMIYAVPPAVRITALGIRSVPRETVEAARAMGATSRQLLLKVQLPLARRMILLSVNQTILFALSMVVIAGLIGGSGLGDTVTNGLYSNPALAVLAGVAIVIMAIALDRATEAAAVRADPARRHLTPADVRRLRLATAATLAAIGLAVGLGRGLGAGQTWQRWTAQDWLLARVQSALDYVQDPSTWVFQVTSPTGNFLVGTPWFATVAGLVAIAFVVSGLRPAFTVLAMLATVGLVGEWQPGMDTASQVLVATALAVAVGVVLGVWAAESTIVSRALRPINDVLQTLPQLVYIIPFVYLMPISFVPGIVASVLYAFPVVVRLVERGVRDVAPAAVEAASAFGATRGQLLLKVKIPLAREAIMLGVNQGIMMVLAVVVIAGLVGSGALGYEVAKGLQRNEFGNGVLASVAILALGIALDRVTQGKRRVGEEAYR